MGIFDNFFKKKEFSENIKIDGKEYPFIADAMVFSQWALDKYESGDYPEAVANFTKAIAAHPGNQNFYTMRGTAYEDMGNDAEAEKDFRKALEILPNTFVAAYRLGMVYYRKKDFPMAVKWLKISYENSPDTGVESESINLGKNNIMIVARKLIAANLGNFLLQLKNHNEALIYLNKAIRLDPKYSNPHMTKGLALVQMGQENEGIEFLKKAGELGDLRAAEILKMLEEQHKQKNKPNPLNIVDDPWLNSKHHLPDLAHSFGNDLRVHFQILEEIKGQASLPDLLTLAVYYTIDLLIEYRDKGMGAVPTSIIIDAKTQVVKGARLYFSLFDKSEIVQAMYAEIDKKIWEPDIVSKTQNYIRRLQP